VEVSSLASWASPENPITEKAFSSGNLPKEFTIAAENSLAFTKLLQQESQGALESRQLDSQSTHSKPVGPLHIEPLMSIAMQTLKFSCSVEQVGLEVGLSVGDRVG